MRTRKEIEKDRELPKELLEKGVACVPQKSTESLTLEVALDIRELLFEIKEQLRPKIIAHMEEAK